VFGIVSGLNKFDILDAMGAEELQKFSVFLTHIFTTVEATVVHHTPVLAISASMDGWRPTVNIILTSRPDKRIADLHILHCLWN
jgi:hypothetical protein